MSYRVGLSPVVRGGVTNGVTGTSLPHPTPRSLTFRDSLTTANSVSWSGCWITREQGSNGRGEGSAAFEAAWGAGALSTFNTPERFRPDDDTSERVRVCSYPADDHSCPFPALLTSHEGVQGRVARP